MLNWIVNTPLKYTDLTEFYLIIHFGLWFLSPPKKQEMYYFPKLLKGNAPRKNWWRRSRNLFLRTPVNICQYVSDVTWICPLIFATSCLVDNCATRHLTKQSTSVARCACFENLRQLWFLRVSENWHDLSHIKPGVYTGNNKTQEI